MFSKTTADDRLAIYKKMDPVGFSRLFRSDKEVSKELEKNKHKFQIRSDKRLVFTSRMQGQLPDVIHQHLIEVKSDPEGVVKEILFSPSKLEELFSKIEFKAFIFNEVKLKQKFPLLRLGVLGRRLRMGENDSYIFEKLTVVRAKVLEFPWAVSAPTPVFPYNYEQLRINHVQTQDTDPILELVQNHKGVTVHFKSFPHIISLVGKYCELIQKVIDGTVIIDSLLINFWRMAKPDDLTRFMEDKRSQTIVLADEMQIDLIPVAPNTFVASIWQQRKDTRRVDFGFKLVDSREKFYYVCGYLFNNCFTGYPIPSENEIRELEVVKQVCARFFP